MPQRPSRQRWLAVLALCSASLLLWVPAPAAWTPPVTAPGQWPDFSPLA